MSAGADPASFHKLFSAKTTKVDLEGGNHREVLAELVDLSVAAGTLTEEKRNKLLAELVAREKIGSTSIGAGIAIPHVKSDTVTETITAVGVSKTGIDYNAPDGEKCDVFFLLVSPKKMAERHLELLRWLAALVRNHDFCRFMRAAKTPREAVGLFKEMGS